MPRERVRYRNPKRNGHSIGDLFGYGRPRPHKVEVIWKPLDPSTFAIGQLAVLSRMYVRASA